MKTELRVDASGKVIAPAPKTPAGDSNRRPYQNDNKRKAPMPPTTSRQVEGDIGALRLWSFW